MQPASQKGTVRCESLSDVSRHQDSDLPGPWHRPLPAQTAKPRTQPPGTDRACCQANYTLTLSKAPLAALSPLPSALLQTSSSIFKTRPNTKRKASPVRASRRCLLISEPLEEWTLNSAVPTPSGQ